MSHALISLNVQIIKGIIKLIQTLVHSGGTISTENGILKSIRNFARVEDS